MLDDHDSVHAQQRGPAVLAVVQTMPRLTKRRTQEEGAQPVLEPGHDRRPELVEDEVGDAFGRLHRYVAGKAIGNDQISEPKVTGGITYVVSGAGGKVRKETPQERRRMMGDRNIAGWASEIHFLLVEIDEDEMEITPYGLDGRFLGLRGRVTVPIVMTTDDQS